MPKKKEGELDATVPEHFQSLDALIKEGLTISISHTRSPNHPDGTHYKFVASSPRGMVNEEVTNFDLSLGFNDLLTKVRERLKKLSG